MKRTPRESAKAIEAYGIYRDMGPDRTLERVAQELHKSKTLIGRWSTQHGWVERIADFERNVAQRRQAESEQAEAEERQRLRRVRLQSVKTQQAIAMKRLNGLLQDEAAIHRLDVRDVVALLKNAHETQRLEYGEATTRAGKGGGPVRFTFTLDRPQQPAPASAHESD